MGKELQTLNERIAEKVGENLVDLIPADQWEKLVSDQIDFFMTNKAPGIIQKLLTEELYKTVAGVLSSSEYITTWGNYGEELAADGVKAIIEKSAPTIFAAMFAPVADGLIRDLVQRLNNPPNQVF